MKLLLIMTFVFYSFNCLSQDYSAQMFKIDISDSSVLKRYGLEYDINKEVMHKKAYDEDGTLLINLIIYETDSLVYLNKVNSNSDTEMVLTYSFYLGKWFGLNKITVFPFLSQSTWYVESKTYQVNNTNILVYKHINTFDIDNSVFDVVSYYIKGIGFFCYIDYRGNYMYILNIERLGYWKDFLEKFINDYDFYQTKYMPAPPYPFD